MQARVQGRVEQKMWNSCFEGSFKLNLGEVEEKTFVFRLLDPFNKTCIMVWDESGEMFAEFTSEIALNKIEFGDGYEWKQKTILYLIAEMMGNFLFGGIRIPPSQKEIPIDNIYSFPSQNEEKSLCATC